MPIIKPISDLRNKSNEISNFVHENSEPVYITKNGAGDMVVMSIAHYNQLQKRLELFSKLAMAEAQKAAGDEGRELNQVMQDIRQKIRAKI